MKRTNYFSGFEHKPRHYEDQLTRAFLVLLRLVPPVQSAFIDYIRDEQLRNGRTEIVPPRSMCATAMNSIWTQTGSLKADEGRVLSILLIDERQNVRTTIKPSERTAVYDGVVHYGKGWIFAIENKPFGGVREEQLNPNIGDTQEMEVDPHLVELEWKELLSRLHTLNEGQLLGYTEALLLKDFLQYVQEDFPALNPYPSLASCKDDLGLLNLRCQQLMQEIAEDRLAYLRGYGHYLEAPELKGLKNVIVRAEAAGGGWHIVLALYPGDTITQARHFFDGLNRSALRSLCDEWTCATNLHFAFMQQNLVWASPQVSIAEYIDFWMEHRERWLRQVKEREFSELLDTLQEVGQLDDRDIEQFKIEFYETRRSTVNVCPGLKLQYRWPAKEATRLDEAGMLVKKIDRRVWQAARVWNAEEQWEDIVAGHADERV